MARRGPVAHYRLSREEYGTPSTTCWASTFDVHLPAPQRRSALARFQSHRLAAVAVVARRPLLPGCGNGADPRVSDQPTAVQKVRREATVRPTNEKRVAPPEGDGPVRWLFWPGHTQGLFNAASPGLYRIRIQLSGVPSFRGRLPHLALWHQGLKRSELVSQDVVAPEDQPTVVEIEAFLPEGGYSLINETPGMLADGHTLSNTQFAFVNTKVSRRTGRPATSCSTTKAARSSRC